MVQLWYRNVTVISLSLVWRSYGSNVETRHRIRKPERAVKEILSRVHRAEVVLYDLRRDRASQNVAGVLVVAPMDPTEDTRVIHIVANLFQLRVGLRDDRGRQRAESGNVVCNRDVVARGAEHTSHHLEPAARAACVIRWIAGKAGGWNARREIGSSTTPGWQNPELS